jgi:glycosyltransferase involved in cell wall biosynthesis
MTAPRVLFCSNYYPPAFVGGAELIAHEQARTLAERGWHVAVFAGDPSGCTARYALRRDNTHDGLRVHRIGLTEADLQLCHLNIVNSALHGTFAAVLETERPDIVHFHNLVGLSVAFIGLARRLGCRTVLTVHDHWGFCFKNTRLKSETDVCRDHTRCAECQPFFANDAHGLLPIRLRGDFVRMQLEQLDAFVSPSEYLAEAYAAAGFPRERIHVVWNGVDVARFSRIEKTVSDRVRFAFIGHLGRHKGPQTLLEALALLPAGTPFVLHVVGIGEEQARLAADVRRLGLGESVRFHGRVGRERIDAIYRETDVLILPSIWPENHPVTVTEAMASRTAVLASRIGGIPELVADGLTGDLFTPGDARELATKMLAFIREPERARRLGEAGFRRIADDTLTNQVARLEAVYRAAAAARPSPGEAARVFACAGRRIDVDCGWVMNALARQGDPRWRFVLLDWLDDEALRDARALWVVDRGAGLECVLRGLRMGVPLLVPEQAAQLNAAVTHGRFGVTYRDAFEAIRWLRVLAEDATFRQAVGGRGHRAWRGAGVPGAVAS